MSSEQFIKDQLNALVTNFPEIRVRYENDEMNSSHLIEIVPNEIYHNQAEFKIAEEYIIFKFIELFSFENIVFFASDEDMKINKVDYEVCGDNFMSHAPTTTSYFNEIVVSSAFNPTDWPGEYTPDFLNTNLLTNGFVIAGPIGNVNLKRYQANSIKCLEDILTTIPNVDKWDIIESGENNYALAA